MYDKEKEQGMLFQKRSQGHLEVHPLTPERWQDLEALFGERGACGGCWCMWWRIPRSQFEQQKGQQNREAFRAMVLSGEVPGLLAYKDGQPIAWCALAPRERYPVLERSRTLGRIDEEPVWSITCFFVAKPFRRQGVTRELLRAAIAFAKVQGATIVEGYPVEPKQAAMPAVFAWTGLVSAFHKVGFVEVLRRAERRPIMRYFVRVPPSGK